MEKRTVKFTMSPLDDVLANSFDIRVTCVGTYKHEEPEEITDTFNIPGEKMTELLMLMLAYLSLDADTAPARWMDSLEVEDAYGFDVFGGEYVTRNERFKIDKHDHWLVRYLEGSNLLLYFSDGLCDSIIDIDVIYHDENGKCFECEMPDIGSMFKSEQEFIEYINVLVNGENLS